MFGSVSKYLPVNTEWHPTRLEYYTNSDIKTDASISIFYAFLCTTTPILTETQVWNAHILYSGNMVSPLPSFARTYITQLHSFRMHMHQLHDGLLLKKEIWTTVHSDKQKQNFKASLYQLSVHLLESRWNRGTDLRCQSALNVRLSHIKKKRSYNLNVVSFTLEVIDP